MKLKKAEHYYDLDGTLSSLNSTFDFIEGYLRYEKKIIKLYFAKIVMVTLMRLGAYDPYRFRKLVILLLFKGLKKESLEAYFEEIYKPIFMNSLTPLGTSLMENKETADVMLTGCTEIPAIKIGGLFGFKKVIATEFFYKRGKVSGIKTDTYGNYKINYIQKSNQEKIYYTDDLQSEQSLIKIMHEIKEV